MIRVPIERIVATGLKHDHDCTIKRTVSNVIQAPACIYISGKSLVDSDTPSRCYVMPKWDTKQNWENWFRSCLQRQVISSITSMLESLENIPML